MTVALAFLKGHWRLVGLAVLLLALAVQSARLSSAKGDLADARAALTNPLTKKTWQSEALRDARNLRTCRDNNTVLQGSLDRQSTAMERLEQAGRTLAADNARLATTARKSAAVAASAQARILARPPAGNDTCSRVLDVEQRFMEELRR